jgi:hypothetical protein
MVFFTGTWVAKLTPVCDPEPPLNQARANSAIGLSVAAFLLIAAASATVIVPPWFQIA